MTVFNIVKLLLFTSRRENMHTIFPKSQGSVFTIVFLGFTINLIFHRILEALKNNLWNSGGDSAVETFQCKYVNL